MTPYSQDLRQRIVDTIQRGDGTIRQVAERFLVSFSFVTRLLQLYRSTGSVEPRPHGGGTPPVLTPEDLPRLRELIRQRPDATLEECRTHLGVSCSLMTLSRAPAKRARRARRRARGPRIRPARRAGRGDGGSARGSPGSAPGGWASAAGAGATRR